jgi:hypothetical protein
MKTLLTLLLVSAVQAHEPAFPFSPTLPKLPQTKQVVDTPSAKMSAIKFATPAKLKPADNPVPFGWYAEVTVEGLASGDSVDFKIRPKPLKQNVENGKLFFNGLEKQYEVDVMVLNWDTRKWERGDIVIDFAQSAIPPPKKPPGTEPPTTPITSLYFVVLRADGPAQPSFTTLMSLPGWVELEKQGHKFKPKTLSAAKADLGFDAPADLKLPAVLTLIDDGMKSKIVRDAIPAPTTNDEILALPKGIK